MSSRHVCLHRATTAAHGFICPAAAPSQQHALRKQCSGFGSLPAVSRYHPPEVSEAMQALARAQESLLAAAKAAWQAFLSDFAALYTPFKAAVQAVAALDVLCSLAVVSSGDGCSPGMSWSDAAAVWEQGFC